MGRHPLRSGSAGALVACVLAMLLVLPSMVGVHDHISYAVAHDQLDDASAADAVDGGLWARALSWFDAGHHLAHEHYGEVDVDPPAKAFSKDLSGKVVLAVILVSALLLPAAPACWQLVGFPAPLRPPRRRSRPHLFPPARAPPSAG